MMQSEHNRTGEVNPPAGTPAPRMLAGLALLAPAALCCILTLALPTLRTITLSFQNANPLGRDAAYVGGANYATLFQDRIFSSALGFTLAIVVTRLLAVAIVPLLLALAAGAFGRRVRIPVRLLFTIPLALFAPVSILLAWLMALNPRFGLLGGQGAGPPLLADPARARVTLLFVDGLITFGLACGLGLVFYLAAVRGSRESPAEQRTWRPLLITWLIGLFATAALALQSFTLSFVLTRGGPGNATMSLGLLYYMQAFQFFRFGPGAAVAVIILAVAGALGLLAGLLVVRSGLQLELVPRRRPAGEVERAGGIQPGAAVLLGIVLLGSVGICALGVLPVPWSGLNSLRSQPEMFSTTRPLFPAEPSLRAYEQLAELPRLAPLNTIVPALIATIIQIALAYAGAIGIGALRPLGRRSELLLLPFSPWLFVTIAPLSVGFFESMRAGGRLNTLVGLVPPILISIPALFILTLFFKGQAARLRELQAEGQPSGFFRTVILPSLPLVGLLACALLLVQMQDLLWPLLVANRPELFTEPVALMALVSRSPATGPDLAAALTAYGLPIFVFFLLAFSLFQAFYLDRLALSAKRDV